MEILSNPGHSKPTCFLLNSQLDFFLFLHEKWNGFKKIQIQLSFKEENTPLLRVVLGCTDCETLPPFTCQDKRERVQKNAMRVLAGLRLEDVYTFPSLPVTHTTWSEWNKCLSYCEFRMHWLFLLTVYRSSLFTFQPMNVYVATCLHLFWFTAYGRVFLSLSSSCSLSQLHLFCLSTDFCWICCSD